MEPVGPAVSLMELGRIVSQPGRVIFWFLLIEERFLFSFLWPEFYCERVASWN